jgi:hypothetical protein
MAFDHSEVSITLSLGVLSALVVLAGFEAFLWPGVVDGGLR